MFHPIKTSTDIIFDDLTYLGSIRSRALYICLFPMGSFSRVPGFDKTPGLSVWQPCGVIYLCNTETQTIQSLRIQ